MEQVHQFPRNVSIRIQKDISSRAGYILKFVGSMPTTRLTDIQENQNYLELVYQHIRNVYKKFRKISLPELEISLYLSNFSKEGGNQQTDRYTKNSELFGTSVPMSRNVLKKRKWLFGSTLLPDIRLFGSTPFSTWIILIETHKEV